MHATAPYLSVVVPCFNEDAALDTLHARLSKVCDDLGHTYEIVLVNDGSRDGSWETMLALAGQDPHLVCVNLSRNHGQQLALTAGLTVCRGDYILIIDADLQDPPEMLPEMFAVMYRERADVVYGQRGTRDGETRFKLLSSFLFYRILNTMTDAPIPRDTGDFRLMTRRVLDQFLMMPERNRFVRGMLSWLGFKQVPLYYERCARRVGVTNYTFWKLYRLAWDAITGFSVRPLTLATFAGVTCLLAAMVTWGLAGGWWVEHGQVPSIGLAVGLAFFLSGGQFLAIGVIGEYLGRIYTEARGRPLFMIDRVVRRPAVEDVFSTSRAADRQHLEVA